MKSLLIALGLALCCFVQAQWSGMTENQNCMGDWKITAAACNSSDTREQLRDMSVFAAHLSRPREDVFSMWVFLPMPDGCKNATYQFRKGEDGKYHGHSDGTAVTVESLKTYGGCVMITIQVGNEFRTTTLHSRSATQDPEILQKFKEECIRLGYSEDEIVVLKLPVKCQ